MTRTANDRAAIALGLGAAVSGLLGWLSRTAPPIDFAPVRTVTFLVLLTLGLLGAAGGLLGSRTLVLLSGAGLISAAVLQLLQIGRPANWLNGNGSTMALLGGFGLGLLAVGLHHPVPTNEGSPPDGP